MDNLINISENTGVTSFPTIFNGNNEKIKLAIGEVDNKISQVAETNSGYNQRLNDLNTQLETMKNNYNEMKQAFLDLKNSYETMLAKYNTIVAEHKQYKDYYNTVSSLIEKIDAKLSKII